MKLHYYYSWSYLYYNCSHPTDHKEHTCYISTHKIIIVLVAWSDYVFWMADPHAIYIANNDLPGGAK